MIDDDAAAAAAAAAAADDDDDDDDDDEKYHIWNECEVTTKWIYSFGSPLMEFPRILFSSHVFAWNFPSQSTFIDIWKGDKLYSLVLGRSIFIIRKWWEGSFNNEISCENQSSILHFKTRWVDGTPTTEVTPVTIW